MSETLAYIRALLARVHEGRAQIQSIQVDVQKASDEVLPLLETVDKDKRGVVFEHNGSKTAGYRQQNKPSTVCDTVGLIAWLKKSGKFEAVSTQTLDMKKLDAEIAAGNIRPRDIKRFFSEGDPATPYVKFMNPKRDSL